MIVLIMYKVLKINIPIKIINKLFDEINTKKLEQ